MHYCYLCLFLFFSFLSVSRCCLALLSLPLAIYLLVSFSLSSSTRPLPFSFSSPFQYLPCSYHSWGRVGVLLVVACLCLLLVCGFGVVIISSLMCLYSLIVPLPCCLAPLLGDCSPFPSFSCFFFLSYLLLLLAYAHISAPPYPFSSALQLLPSLPSVSYLPLCL